MDIHHRLCTCVLPVLCRLVHRLDRGTSGALILARTRDAATRLSRAFRQASALLAHASSAAGAGDKEHAGSGSPRHDLLCMTRHPTAQGQAAYSLGDLGWTRPLSMHIGSDMTVSAPNYR